MAKAPVAPVVLVILDGWGYRNRQMAMRLLLPNPNGQPLAAYPKTLIHTSAKAVGYQKVKWATPKLHLLALGE